MADLITGIVLLAITIFAMRRHLRSRAAGAGGRSGLHKACPRCGAVNAQGTASCARSGVPLSAFEIVGAKALTASPSGASPSGGEIFRARRVVLAMGRRGVPRRLGVRGEEAGKVVYDVAEMEVFAGRRVLVVGGGDSAVESALGLSNQPGTDVTLCHRAERIDKAREGNQAKLAAAVRSGAIKLLLRTQVREIRSDVVVLDVAGQSTLLANDDVIVRVGGEPPKSFLDRVGVRSVRKDVPVERAATEATVA